MLTATEVARKIVIVFWANLGVFLMIPGRMRMVTARQVKTPAERKVRRGLLDQNREIMA